MHVRFSCRVPYDGTDEFSSSFVDFTVVVLSKEAVEVVFGLGEGCTGFDDAVDFIQLGVLWPNLHGLSDFGLSIFGVAFGEVIFSHHDVHVAGSCECCDGCGGAGRVEVICTSFKNFDGFGCGVKVLGFHCGEEDVGIANIAENLPLFETWEGVDGGHEFSNKVGFGESFGGGVEFVLIDEE